LKPNAKIVAAPDSGLFLDFKSAKTNKHEYRERIMNFMLLANKEVDPIVHGCVAKYKDEKWKCLFA